MIATEKITLAVSQEKEFTAIETVSRAEERERKSKEGLRMVREMARVVGKRGPREMPQRKEGVERVEEAIEYVDNIMVKYKKIQSNS